MAEPAANPAANPAAQFFDPEGRALTGSALSEAWSSGTAHVAAGAQVHMLTPEGDLRLVPAEQVATARAKGYAPAPAEVVEQHALQREHGGIGGQAATVAESAADMASLGGYGYAASKLSPSYAHEVLQRREANPISHVAGSVVGLAPSLLTGAGEAEAGIEGAELAAHAGQAAHGAEAAAAAPGLLRQGLGAANAVAAAPLKVVGTVGGIVERGVARGLKSLGVTGESLAGRVAEKAATTGAAGVAEGAIFGIGSTLSDSSLEGKDLTSEALVSGIGRNALFGGALGAGMGAMSELGSAAIHGVLPDSEALAKFAKEQGGRSVGVNATDRARLGDRLDMTQDELLSYEAKTDGPSMKKGQRMFSAASNAEEMAANLEQAKAETGAAKGGIVQEIDQALLSNPQVAAVAQPDVGEFFDRVDNQVIEKLRANDAPSIKRKADKVIRELEPLRADYEASKAYAADAAARATDPAAIANDVVPPEFKPITFARLDAFKQSLDDIIYPKGGSGTGIQVASKVANELKQVRGILAKFQDESAQRALAAMGEDPAAYAMLNRQYSSLSSLKKIADRTAGRMRSNRMNSPTDHALGLGGMLLSMLSGSTGALGAMAYGGAAAIANKMLRERGNSILADIAYRTSKMDNLLENTAHALAISPERLAQPLEAAEEVFHHKSREKLAESEYVPLGIKALGKDFEETSKRVQDLAEPAAQHEQLTRATGDIAAHYPEQASAMSAKLLGIYQHLAATLPQPQGGSQLSPLSTKPRVPPREQARFLSRVNAALNPASVIADIGNGKLDKDALDTLQQMYPATFGVLKQKVMTQLAASKTELPYSRTVHVGMVFGFDSDPSLANIASIQQTIQEINAPRNGKPPGASGAAKRGNPGKSGLGKSFALPGAAVPGA